MKENDKNLQGKKSINGIVKCLARKVITIQILSWMKKCIYRIWSCQDHSLFRIECLYKYCFPLFNFIRFDMSFSGFTFWFYNEMEFNWIFAWIFFNALDYIFLKNDHIQFIRVKKQRRETKNICILLSSL